MVSDNPESLVGKQLHELVVSNEGYGSAVEAHKSALEGIRGEYEVNYAGRLFFGHTEPLYEDGAVVGVVGLGYDISAQRRYEDELKDSLREKEILIREIRHRVKNNLQLIQSMLSIHSSQTKIPEARVELATAIQRVNSLTTAYDLLITKERIGFVQMREYIRSITDTIVQSTDKEIEVTTEVAALEFHLDTAVPCGMLVNELVSLSVFHSLAEAASGTVSVGLQAAGDDVAITVSDNGRNPLADGDTAPDLMILEALVSQLDGTMTSTSRDGMSVEVRFTPKAASGT